MMRRFIWTVALAVAIPLTIIMYVQTREPLSTEQVTSWQDTLRWYRSPEQYTEHAVETAHAQANLIAAQADADAKRAESERAIEAQRTATARENGRTRIELAKLYAPLYFAVSIGLYVVIILGFLLTGLIRTAVAYLRYRTVVDVEVIRNRPQVQAPPLTPYLQQDDYIYTEWRETSDGRPAAVTVYKPMRALTGGK